MLNLPRLQFLDVQESIFSLLDKPGEFSPTEEEAPVYESDEENNYQGNYEEIGLRMSDVIFTTRDIAQISQILRQSFHGILTQGTEYQNLIEVDIKDEEIKVLEKYLNFVLQYELSQQVKINRVNFFSTPK